MHNAKNHHPRLSSELDDIFRDIMKQHRVLLHIKARMANHWKTHEVIKSIEDLNFQVVRSSFTVSLRNVASDLVQVCQCIVR